MSLLPEKKSFMNYANHDILVEKNVENVFKHTGADGCIIGYE